MILIGYIISKVFTFPNFTIHCLNFVSPFFLYFYCKYYFLYFFQTRFINFYPAWSLEFLIYLYLLQLSNSLPFNTLKHKLLILLLARRINLWFIICDIFCIFFEYFSCIKIWVFDFLYLHFFAFTKLYPINIIIISKLLC